ncbi:MAG: DNA mismatch repair protein MutS [Beijerinckiaceae bacterium]|nr:DNA mismatch repair protein MutS [Beijerinckiaceae bacterium]
MMVQYLAIKAAHPDALLFYRMGDFYELFFGDAEIAAKALGIVLTRRGKHEGADIPMCGVPVERSDDYLHRLIEQGHRVAICEQIEDPAEARKRGAKSVVERAVVRLVTPGTLTEDRLLEPGRANWLLAFARTKSEAGGWLFGLAAIDISTGAFEVSEAPLALLGNEIGRIDPREIIVPDAIAAIPEVARLLAEHKAPVTKLGREPGSAERRLLDFFGLATLEGLGDLSGPEIAAAATAIFYLERTQCGARPNLQPPRRTRRASHMEVDAATRANLELTRTLAGAREGALLAAIDRCATPAGSRLLAAHLSNPLTDRGAIESRLEAVAFLLEHRELRAGIRANLKTAPDLARALSRVGLNRAGPRDLAALRDGLGAARALALSFDDAAFPLSPPPPLLLAAAQKLVAPSAALATDLTDALSDALPLQRRDGGFVREGRDAALDEMRALRDESRQVIAALQARYCDLADTKRLKVKHNNMLGYYVEVPQALGERFLEPPLNATFIHRQTMIDAMRFSTTELAELESKIAAAGDGALARESAIFDELTAAIMAQAADIADCANALAAIDVAAGLAELAAARDWTRPIIETSGAFVIEGGRHPVVEDALRLVGEPFVANHCDLSARDGVGGGGGQIAVVTGPNMAGKSTFLRQNALIAVLAQMGSYVPATKAVIGIVDRLFSRVGAADDLARGRSTFMVEMVETAAILNQATPSSLVILDEIGRGTATFDGLSIAWAVIEHLHEKNRSRAIFATHFHELTQLTQRLSRLVNLTSRVADWHGDVVFLHEVVAGAADRSYGIQVAKLAGLPPAVVKRAKAILSELEAGDRGAPVARMIADLPLFAAAQVAEPAPTGEAGKLREALDAIDPDALTPRDALEALYRLKALAEDVSG